MEMKQSLGMSPDFDPNPTSSLPDLALIAIVDRQSLRTLTSHLFFVWTCSSAKATGRSNADMPPRQEFRETGISDR